MIKRQYSNGVILVTTLLLLFVITLLLFGASESALLQVKMNASFQDKAIAFESAESGIRIAEATLTDQMLIKPNTGAVINYRIRLTHQDQCGNQFFEIVSKANYHGAASTIISQYKKFKIPPLLGCQHPVICGQRTSWKEEHTIRN